jgi:penicillin-binding protein 2
MQWGVDPLETVHCSGVYRVGNGLFHCWRHSGHGPIAMQHAIAQSCDVYFYTMGRRIGIDKIAPMARMLGLGEKFDLPVPQQRYGTVPDSAWKLKRYKAAWTTADTVNASIGQGYMLTNPLQLAVMAARIASGTALAPRLIGNRTYGPQGASLNIPPSHLQIVHGGMRDVINNGGTALRARLPLTGIEMAGKTGSAQVRRISMADRRAGRTASEGLPWKYRDHGHFIGFAPVIDPRYAIGVTLEHGNHGPVAAEVARDVLTYLYDPDRAMATLASLERGWGGDITARMAGDAERWAAAQAPVAAPDPAPVNAQDAEVPE